MYVLCRFGVGGLPLVLAVTTLRVDKCRWKIVLDHRIVSILLFPIPCLFSVMFVHSFPFLNCSLSLSLGSCFPPPILRVVVVVAPALESIDRYRIAAPFASLIRSEEASGPITGAAFAALLRFVQHDVFGTHACECESARLSLSILSQQYQHFRPLEFLRITPLCAILCACADIS